DCRAANKNWLGDLFVDYYLDGTQNSLVFAVGVDNPLWSFFGLHEQRAHELARVIHQAHQLLTIGLDVGDRTGRNAGVHGGLGHRRSNLDDQARIEWLGNDVLGAERKILAGVGICHFVVLLGLSQFGDGTNAGQLHFLVDDGGAHVQSATENEGEAQNVIDLVGVIGTAGCNDAVSARLLRHFGADFGFRVGQCQDQRTIGHSLDHVGGEDPRSRAAQEHVGVLADICQGTGVSLLSVFGLGLFHALFTAFVNDAARVGYIDVAARKSQADKKVQAGDGSGAGSRTNQLYARDVLADHLETVEDRSSRNDGRAVLVVVEDRNLHAFAKLLFDIEAFGSLDVFKIDPTQGGL